MTRKALVAALLVERDGPGDRARARELATAALATAALATAEEQGMAEVAARARAVLDRAG